DTVDIFAMPPKLLFFKPVMENYRNIFAALSGQSSTGTEGVLLKNIFNSVKASVISVIVASFIAIPAAYALARFRFNKKNTITFWILSLMIMPPIAVLLPWLTVFHFLKIYDTITGLVIIYTTFNVPFIIWLARGFFKEIPREIEEAALVDGCTHITSLFRITLPLAKPGLSAAIILSIVFTWNDFIFALVLTGVKTMTAPVTLTGYISLRQIHWPQLAAGGVITMLPPIILALIAQKYIVRGLTFGAVK
ncbi:MAG: carbohydrate ABC transporter permease, partial [Actinobacteria bacterium]|nr:carbohydrate ABC transporter permease [Actinomycetota bacterium]